MPFWNNKVIRLAETRLIIAISVLYTMIQFITFINIGLKRQMHGSPLEIGAMLEDRLVACLIAYMYVTLIVLTTRRFLMKRKSWFNIILIHLVFAVLISFLWYSTFTLAESLLGNSNGYDEDFFVWYLSNFDKLFLLYLFTVSVSYTYYYVQLSNRHKIQKSQIETQLLQTRLMMLKSQLHPHFLFNTLNSIASLIDIDVRRAKKMIADLGDLLRFVLDFKDLQIVSLTDEIALLDKYMAIEKTRFAEDLRIEMEVEEAVKQASVPSMILQPLVENSIQHGFSSEHPQLDIRISLFREAESLIILVQDNGKGFQEKESQKIFNKGTGLRNTFERLKSIYGEQFNFFVENLTPGVSNRIEIPLKFG